HQVARIAQGLVEGGDRGIRGVEIPLVLLGAVEAVAERRDRRGLDGVVAEAGDRLAGGELRLDLEEGQLRAGDPAEGRLGLEQAGHAGEEGRDGRHGAHGAYTSEINVCVISSTTV